MLLKCLNRKNNNKNIHDTSDKIYSSKEVMETLLGKIIKIDIGGAPDGSFYVPGLVLPDKETKFAIHHRWENSKGINVCWPYVENAGIKKNGFNGSHQFNPWGLSANCIDSFLPDGGNSYQGYKFKSNPEYLSLDKILNENGLTIGFHEAKIKEFNKF